MAIEVKVKGSHYWAVLGQFALAFCGPWVGTEEPPLPKTWLRSSTHMRPGLATDSIFFCKNWFVRRANHWPLGWYCSLRSIQQLDWSRSWILKGFFWADTASFKGPQTCLMLCLRNYNDTVRCAAPRREVQLHHQKQLQQTLIVCLQKTNLLH